MPTPHQMQLLRQLPQVEELLHHPAIEAIASIMPRPLVRDQVRKSVDGIRSAILTNKLSSFDDDDIAANVLRGLLKLEQPSLKRVINASGVIVHTNLGRSVLADSAAEAVSEVARGYSTLEYNVNTQSRGSRHDHYEQLICTLTGAEAAIAVNNNAAAVLMVLHEFARGRKVVISRGELVEIGGSFRVPDIMALSGAEMVEVGTTNKTHPHDYANAVDTDTAMLVKVHPSNYRMTGFTESVDAATLATLAQSENAKRRQIARAQGIPGGESPLLVYEDLGSGALVDFTIDGFHETTVSEVLREGADLVSFSCDKLLGGPQAGIIVGSKAAIDRLKRNPYARAMRLDKLTIAALESTLRLYLDEDIARKEIPTVRMLSESAEDTRERAEKIANAIAHAVPDGAVTVSVEPDTARAGGGALPMCDIDTYVAAVSFKRGSLEECEHAFVAERDVPVIPRIHGDRMLLDARTVQDDSEIAEIAHAFTEYFAQHGSKPQPRNDA